MNTTTHSPPLPPTLMPSKLYKLAERVSDFICWNIRIIIVVVTSVVSLTLATMTASLGNEEWAKYIIYAAAVIDMLVLAYMGRLPTSSIYSRFMATYARGPWTAQMSMPPIDPASRKARITRMSDVMYNLDGICTRLVATGANRATVKKWAESLGVIATELL